MQDVKVRTRWGDPHEYVVIESTTEYVRARPVKPSAEMVMIGLGGDLMFHPLAVESRDRDKIAAGVRLLIRHSADREVRVSLVED